MKNRIKNNLPIILTLILACIVYIWKLWDEGLGNLYYSSGVYSMGQNFHAFFYNSIDSVGFISIDKPPLGLWIQVIFTKIFGFNGMIILLPQAIAGVLSVYFIYKMIKKRFGEGAGIVSALVLTLTPIFVAVSRNNTIDGILILMLILASDQAIKATEKSNPKHLIYAGILIGLGFNVKMLQAYMIVPAIYLTYFVFSKEKISKKIISCAISIMLLIVISLSWIIAVDLTPSENRPYVGSSSNNSALNLTLGYNGLGRLIGMEYSRGTNNENNNQPIPPTDDGERRLRPPRENDPDRDKGNNIKGLGGEAGATSISRLYNNKNAGQISWFLLPSFIVCVLCLYQLLKERLKQNPKNIATFYFMSCFIPMFIYFSFSNGVAHRYYLAMLAFPIATIIGIGFDALEKHRKILIPLIFGITAFSQLYIQSLYKNWIPWFSPLCIVIFIITMVLMLVGIKKGVKNKVIAYLLSVLLIMPAVWSFTPIIYGNNAQLPISGPELMNQGDHFDGYRELSQLIAFLKENREDADYLVAVPSAMNLGSELILQSGEPVMVLGGFNGGDTPLTVEEFENMVNKGTIKYALINSSTEKKGIHGFNNSISEWITANGIEVNEELELKDNMIDGMRLYRLK